ncbi:MAG: HPr family phosphocarrier protein [Planctomycetaceae bacterium]|nr:HPr family phosphocarrier protein [Planctomycetaceae bacterium]
MTGQKLSRTVVVTSPQGLHVRSADLFVKMASRYQTEIEVVKDNLRVNGKSILDILMLAATEGTTLVLEAGGADAAEALEALAELIEQNFGEQNSSS